MSDDLRKWFTHPLPLRQGAKMQTGTIRIHEDVMDKIISTDFDDSHGCMVVAHVDLAGRLVIDEVIDVERTK